MQTKPSKISRTITALSVLCVAVLIPAVIFVGLRLFGNTNHFIVSLAVVVLAMVPFFLSFEGRAPRARELVIVAVFTAITVVSRVAFFMLPQIKPMCAVVIIAGVCFGAQSGFMVGALSALISNFYFGQGSWTPFQMLGFGLVGFFAGLLFCGGPLKAGRLSLCAYGGLATLLIYGVISDLSAVVMFDAFTPNGVLATLAAGVSFNLVHAAGTVVFLFIFAKPMTSKLERIKRKYGIGSHGRTELK